jgi:hypothetical protein
MVRPNDGVALSMTNMLAVHRTLAQGSAVGDLPPSISPLGVALYHLLLAAQVLPQLAAWALAYVLVSGS